MSTLRPPRRCFLLLLLLLVSGAVVGCESTPATESRDLRVVPFANRYVTALDASQTVELMRRAGFSRDQILEHGTDLRNALAVHGGGRIHQGHRVRAIFAVHEHHLYVSTDTGAAFIYELETPEPSSGNDE